MAISYAYNQHGDGFGNLAPFAGAYDPTDPLKRNRQKRPYLPSRKAALGPVQIVQAIPHRTEIEEYGVALNAQYGDGVRLHQVEGAGNSGNYIAADSADDLLATEVNGITYAPKSGPIEVKVIDPLMVIRGKFTIQVLPDRDLGFEAGSWVLYGDSIDTVHSEQAIVIDNEQLVSELGLSVRVLQPKVFGEEGAVNSGYVGSAIQFADETDRWLGGINDLDNDERFNWIKSGKHISPYAGSNTQKDHALDDHYDNYELQARFPAQGDSIVAMDTALAVDEFQDWEQVVDRTWSPFVLASYDTGHPIPLFPAINEAPYYKMSELMLRYARKDDIPGVDLVITPDRSKWTRCPVFEAQDQPLVSEGSAVRGELRRALSVDKQGRNQLDPNCNIAEATANNTQLLGVEGIKMLRPSDRAYFESKGIDETMLASMSMGMGWFPGYAIDIETGLRLNMAFAEDSWLKNENGNDMQWNPTSAITEDVFGEVRFGGRHMVYVFKANSLLNEQGYENFVMPAYDQGSYAFEQMLRWNPREPLHLFRAQSDAFKGCLSVYASCAWVGYPVLQSGAQMFGASGQNVVRIQLRAARKFQHFSPGSPTTSLNAGQRYYLRAGSIDGSQDSLSPGSVFTSSEDLEVDSATAEVVPCQYGCNPTYTFSTAHLFGERAYEIGREALSYINVVPNPYYGYSAYEQNRVVKLVKVVNLPPKCEVRIFTLSGALVRVLEKDNELITSVDWDLNNQQGIPVSSGIYLFHIDAGPLGEKVVKWFGVQRPMDLTAF